MIIDEIRQFIASLDVADVTQGRHGDVFRIQARGCALHLGIDACKWAAPGVELILTDPSLLAALRLELAHCATEHRGQRSSNLIPISEIPGLVRAETVTQARMDELCAPYLKPTYSRDEVFGAHCFLEGHIAAPYEHVVDYCADPMALVEWTVNIRNLSRQPDGLCRGDMVFSSADAAHPTTSIFIRADVSKGSEQSLVCYPCAWDQGDDLWMRYYFILADSQKAIGKPGTLVLWANCKHPFYDRATSPVPQYIEEGRARTDRPWAGDGWPFFYPLHALELSNLKTVIEHRYRRDDSR